MIIIIIIKCLIKVAKQEKLTQKNELLNTSLTKLVTLQKSVQLKTFNFLGK